MRAHRFLAAGFLVVAMLAVAVGSADAQTTAVGPYYATPSWDQKLPCSSASNCPRFIVLSNWNSEAVLDRETGLVWERAPETLERTWVSAHHECANLKKGDRMGWRLPTVEELGSLADPTGISPTLPAGHPFSTVQLGYYWSATTREHLAFAFKFSFSEGDLSQAFPFTKTESTLFWCVRGGQGLTQVQ